MTAEYLTLLSEPPAEWWAELEAQGERSDVCVQRRAGESAGQPCWRLTLQGEAEQVGQLRTWAVRRCWELGLKLFTV
ncbi:hypothetical protein [Deinococcus sp. Marseille-Q6407]|uniref:hypothetical protein n=1 Tax=Deinococcus sp. Marseille-Q6407 TaxID=2969223 RepID=UPI0021BE0943|nr:hypothetical protein [Deinococcus sp. Marseille-Q6407]